MFIKCSRNISIAMEKAFLSPVLMFLKIYKVEEELKNNDRETALNHSWLIPERTHMLQML